MLCEMEKHIKRIKNSNGIPIKPMSIVQRLKFINRSFQHGRQEDAHEFLRYLIDHMWKACLMNSDISVKNNSGDKIDPRIKETTAINHIFGGYHRSQVLCLGCNSRSNTFDFFMDFILDIRNAKSLEDSLRKFTQPETLDQDNAYKCGKCKRKVAARKRFSVYRAPNVATFQLKRFDSDRIFGGKITKYVSYPEELDLRPYMSDSTKSAINYQLSAVLVHLGHSSNSGHYFCFIKNSNGFWYRMDDSNVTVVNKNVVLQQQAYILFYTKKASDFKIQSVSNGIEQTKGKGLDPGACVANNKIDNESKKQQINGTSKNLGNCKVFDQKNEHSAGPEKETPSIDKPNGAQSEPIHDSQALNSSKKLSSSVMSNTTNNNNHNHNIKPPITPLTTWLGMKSKLDEDDTAKRKLNEVTERDRFNEELDQGKTKKIRSQSSEEKFNNLSKSNPFQRFNGSNGYQQLDEPNSRQENNKNVFHSKNYDRQYGNDNNKHHNFHRLANPSKSDKFRRHNKHKFNNHHGKHRNGHFNRK